MIRFCLITSRHFAVKKLMDFRFVKGHILPPKLLTRPKNGFQIFMQDTNVVVQPGRKKAELWKQVSEQKKKAYETIAHKQSKDILQIMKEKQKLQKSLDQINQYHLYKKDKSLHSIPYEEFKKTEGFKKLTAIKEKQIKVRQKDRQKLAKYKIPLPVAKTFQQYYLLKHPNKLQDINQAVPQDRKKEQEKFQNYLKDEYFPKLKQFIKRFGMTSEWMKQNEQKLNQYYLEDTLQRFRTAIQELEKNKEI